MAARLPGDHRRVTLGADKGDDTGAFVAALRELNVTPHVVRNTSRRGSRIDARTTRHASYPVSERKPKQVGEVFGWIKTTAGLRKTRHRGRDRADGCSPLPRLLPQLSYDREAECRHAI
jgi:hypothetical protein